MANRTTDHQLLLGLLALQNNFIDQTSMLNAIETWTGDKSRDIGGILVEQGAIDAETCDLIEALTRKHVERHDDDPRKSLAGLSSIGSVLPRVESLADPDLRESLATLSRGGSEAGPIAPRDPDAAPSATGPTDDDPYATRLPDESTAGAPGKSGGGPGGLGMRFRIIRSHARGGLGEVFLAHDHELKREVALKEIQDRHADHPDSRSRFVMEAEVTGGLEHPGIVPIYGLGQYADGRPYYAMRFIRGDSLHDAIRLFHEADTPGRDRGERELEIRKLLGRFIDVCNAIAYAHSRHVLHRDIKPGNIMLGPYGETLVVDWGLAKSMARPDPAQGGTSPTESGDVDATRMGQVVGTPQFMSPEQAAGAIDRLGPASDTYSLGATLYVLLTGKMPFVDRDISTLLEKVRTGEFPAPRQVGRLVPPALEGICLKAMALRPEDRYGSPRDLADDIEHWMADEPVTAYREPFAARAGRWARRHKPLVAGVAVLLLTGMLASTIGYFLVSRERDQKEKQRSLAVKYFGQARGAVKDFLIGIGANKEVSVGGAGQELGESLLAKGLVYYNDFLKEQADRPELRAETAEARYYIAYITDQIGSKKEAMGGYLAALRDYEQLATGAVGAEVRSGLARARRELGRLQRETGQDTEAEVTLGHARDEFEALARDDPSAVTIQTDLARTLDYLGNVLRKTGRRDEGLIAQRRALEIRERLAQGSADIWLRHELTLSQVNFGILLAEGGKTAEAIAALERAVESQDRLVAERPAYPKFRRDLAFSHHSIGRLRLNAGDPEAALQSQQRAVEIRRRLVADYPASNDYQIDLGVSYQDLGTQHRDAGRLDRADDLYRQAMEIRARLHDGQPAVIEYRRSLGDIKVILGDLRVIQKRPAEALDSFQSARLLYEGLVKENPRTSEFRVHLAYALAEIGKLQRAARRLPEALASLQAARDLRETLVRENPDVARYKNNLVASDVALGNYYLYMPQVADALPHYQRALDVGGALVKADPDDLGARFYLAGAWHNRGIALAKLARHAEAADSFRRAVEEQSINVDRAAKDPKYRRLLGEHYLKLAEAERAAGRPAEADAALAKRKALSAGLPTAPGP